MAIVSGLHRGCGTLLPQILKGNSMGSVQVLQSSPSNLETPVAKGTRGSAVGYAGGMA